MKTMLKRKWLVMAATLAIFLSVGAVAWAATDEGVTNSTVAGEETVVTVGAVAESDSNATVAEAGSGPRQATREAREQWLKRKAAKMQELREGMTPEDQAVYDELVETLKEKRAALQEARKDLAATLKELRDLAHKYLDAQS
jgi:vacuolar-type H+-ATPase subunit I/STV1